MDAVSYSDTHVKAIGKDKAYTAMPVGQEIRDAQEREGQGQHNEIVPTKKNKQLNSVYSYSIC